MAESRQFTTQLQAGLGMINETLALLRLWEAGDTPARLAERATSTGVFARTTARRARNIVVEMFAPRYLATGDQPAGRLKMLLDAGQALDDLSQMFFLHTSRAQAIFGEFVTTAFWPHYSSGAVRLGRQHAESFIRRALDDGRMRKRWTESTIRRVSGYLISCCADFGLLTRTSRVERAIQRFAIRPAVALYLAHDLHFAGVSDAAVLSHGDWKLFGLDPSEVVDQLKTLAHDGHVLVQAGGDIVQLTWKYRSMEDCIRALPQR
jgi:Putative inner membrane protein (DUF1819)